MKHIIILDDNRKSNKALMAVARSMKNIKVLTEKQFALLEDEILFSEMKKAEKTPLISIETFKKQVQKMYCF
jgi:hypothetical protein